MTQSCFPPLACCPRSGDSSSFNPTRAEPNIEHFMRMEAGWHTGTWAHTTGSPLWEIFEGASIQPIDTIGVFSCSRRFDRPYKVYRQFDLLRLLRAKTGLILACIGHRRGVNQMNSQLFVLKADIGCVGPFWRCLFIPDDRPKYRFPTAQQPNQRRTRCSRESTGGSMRKRLSCSRSIKSCHISTTTHPIHNPGGTILPELPTDLRIDHM